METKICTKCDEEKQITEFYKEKHGKYGVTSICKKCILIKQKKYRQTEKGKEVYKKYNRSEKGRKRQKKYNRSEEGRKKIKEYKKKYYESEEAKKKLNKRLKKYRMNGSRSKTHRKYYLKNKEKIAKRNKNYSKTEEFKIKRRNNKKKRIENLNDSYIKELITRGSYSAANITPEMIELKREQITIHRLLKEIKNGTA